MISVETFIQLHLNDTETDPLRVRLDDKKRKKKSEGKSIFLHFFIVWFARKWFPELSCNFLAGKKSFLQNAHANHMILRESCAIMYKNTIHYS